MPDEEFGELPMAFVVRQSGVDITERELIDYVAGNSANFIKLVHLFNQIFV